MTIYRHIFLCLNTFLYKCLVLRCSPRQSMSWMGPHSPPGMDRSWQQHFGHDPQTHCDTSHGHRLQGHCHNDHPSHSQRYLHTVTESVTTGAGETSGTGRAKHSTIQRSSLRHLCPGKGCVEPGMSCQARAVSCPRTERVEPHLDVSRRQNPAGAGGTPALGTHPLRAAAPVVDRWRRGSAGRGLLRRMDRGGTRRRPCRDLQPAHPAPGTG